MNIIKAIFSVAILIFSSTAFPQGAELIKKNHGNISTEIFGSEKVKLDRIRSKKGIKSTMMVDVDLEALNSNTINVELEGLRIVAVNHKKETRSQKDFSWFGSTSDGGDVVLTREGNDFSGVIRHKGRTFEFRNFQSGHKILLEMDQREMVDHSPKTKDPKRVSLAVLDAKPGTPVGSPGNTQSNSGPEIRIFVIYTQAVESHWGSGAASFQRGIDEMNMSFYHSKINLVARLAGTAKVSGEPTRVGDAIESLRWSTSVRQLRDQHQADAVVLVADFEDACGEAMAIKASPTTAFAVVDVNCFNSNFSFSHEIGHLFGARHNIGVDPSLTPFPYGHGFGVYSPSHGCYRSIMMYPVSNTSICGNVDQRINRWSNPETNVYFFNSVSAFGNNERANNARVLNEVGPDFSLFNNTPISSGANKPLVASVVMQIYWMLE